VTMKESQTKNEQSEGTDRPERTTQVVKDRIEQDTSKAIATIKRKPAIGVLVASGLGLVGASVIGVGEMAIVLAAGYAAYRALTA
jgi:hypothetical protein